MTSIASIHPSLSKPEPFRHRFTVWCSHVRPHVARIASEDGRDWTDVTTSFPYTFTGAVTPSTQCPRKDKRWIFAGWPRALACTCTTN